ncbi:Uncharacterised protein [Mycobacteroides abscessus subsp. abscessus]|nr:Uncharacterised protein [Mycobacteroides abscessus subsp. abscessus]
MSLRATTICEMIAGIIAVTACGSRTDSIICVLRIPSALAASVCPVGSDLMPERRISAITEPL